MPGTTIIYCPYPGCDKQFCNRWSITRHLRSHTATKPFQCDMDGCGKMFVERCALNRHKQTHMSTKEWKCPLDGCKKSFKLKEYLGVHIKVHLRREKTKTVYPSSDQIKQEYQSYNDNDDDDGTDDEEAKSVDQNPDNKDEDEDESNSSDFQVTDIFDGFGDFQFQDSNICTDEALRWWIENYDENHMNRMQENNGDNSQNPPVMESNSTSTCNIAGGEIYHAKKRKMEHEDSNIYCKLVNMTTFTDQMSTTTSQMHTDMPNTF
eukprot:gene11468-23984_t